MSGNRVFRKLKSKIKIKDRSCHIFLTNRGNKIFQKKKMFQAGLEPATYCSEDSRVTNFATGTQTNVSFEKFGTTT